MSVADGAPALGFLLARFPEHRELTLHCLADVHLAADHHQRKALLARLKAVKDAGPSHRLIVHGDWLDFRNKAGKSFAHGAMAPQAELDECIKVLQPVADRCDLFLNGNHERRSEREAGLDAMATIAARLGRSQAYRRGPSVVRYSYSAAKGNHGHPRFNAEVLVHHGFGGGSPGGSRNNIEKLANWKQDVDAVVMGHTHANEISKRNVYTSWPPRVHEQTLVVTGTWVGHEDYAQEMGLAQSWVGAPTIHLSGNYDTGLVIVRASLG